MFVTPTWNLTPCTLVSACNIIQNQALSLSFHFQCSLQLILYTVLLCYTNPSHFAPWGMAILPLGNQSDGYLGTAFRRLCHMSLSLARTLSKSGIVNTELYPITTVVMLESNHLDLAIYHSTNLLVEGWGRFDMNNIAGNMVDINEFHGEVFF